MLLRYLFQLLFITGTCAAILAAIFGWATWLLAIVLAFQALAILGGGLQLAKVRAGVSLRPGETLSTAFAQSSSARQLLFNAAAYMGGNLSGTIFAGICGFCGMVLSARVVHTPIRSASMQYVGAFFVFPMPLMFFISASASFWLVYLPLAEAEATSWLFRLTSALSIIGFVLFSLHFFSRAKFMKNFSTSIINPLLFYALATLFAVLASIGLRLVFDHAFGDPAAPRLTAFEALQSISQKIDLLDPRGLIGDASSFADAAARLRDGILTLTWEKALEIYLGVAIVSTIIRGLLSAVRFEREDEDNHIVASLFLACGNASSAQRYHRAIKDREKRAGLSGIVAAMEGDYDAFAAAAEEIKPGPEFSTKDVPPAVIESISLTQVLPFFPIPMKNVSAMINGYYARHGDLASLFGLVMAYIHQHPALTERFIKEYGTTPAIAKVDAIMVSFNSAVAEGRNFAEAVMEDHGPDAHALALICSSILMMEMDPGTRETHEKNLNAGLATLLERFENGASLGDFAPSLIGAVNLAQGYHKTRFGHPNATLGKIIRLIENDMTHMDPAFLDKIKKLRNTAVYA